MQLPNGKGRSVVLWGIGISAGLLLILVMSKYPGPPVPMGDTFKNIVKKSEIVSQMRINLHKSVEMEKNAVMALTDDESQEFAGQSLASSAIVEQNLKLLRSLIDAAPLQDEKKLVVEFADCWTKLRELDQIILELAVQSTNLKAESLSRGKGAEAMQRCEHALENVMRSCSGTTNEGRVARLSGFAIAAGLRIEILHAAHIPEASDEKMDQIETQMKADESDASKSIDELAGIVGEENRAAILQAKAAFAEFMDVTAKVIKLSRQNSNVKSLELSLGRKRKLAAQCDEILGAFQEAVKNRTFRATK